MTTLENILKEADKMAQMTSSFLENYTAVVAEEKRPTKIPALNPSQGEQKIPMVKPNGVSK